MIFLEFKKKIFFFIVFDIKCSFALSEVAITGCGDKCVWIIVGFYLFIYFLWKNKFYMRGCYLLLLVGKEIISVVDSN